MIGNAKSNTRRPIQWGVRALVIAVATCVVGMSRGAVAGDPAFRFSDVTATCGIDFTMRCGKSPSREIIEVNGGGVALFDFDNDGDLDLFFANGATMDDPEHGPGSRLYANRGDGTFEDVTQACGIKLNRWAMGVAIGDYDGDGCDDVYVTCYGPNVLLRNECGGPGLPEFVDVTATAGVGDDRWGTSAAFADVDLDGDLDLYVVNYLEFDVKNPPDRRGKTFKGAPVMAGPSGLTPQGDVLYENMGGGRFRDATKQSGCVPEASGYGLGVRIFDFDRDAKPDIFVGNDSTENFLFHNLGGGKFEEVGVIAGVAANYDGHTQATMGVAIGDVDGNGYPDLFSTNFSSDTNTLHLNLGDGFFDDRTSQYGLAMMSMPFLSWGTGLYDFDCDGDEDLFIASGHVYPEAAGHSIDSDYEQVPLLLDRRGKRFHRADDAGNMFQKRFSARSTAFGDLDGDGDVDIVMTTLNGRVRVFRNDTRLTNRVVVELIGPAGNRHGYGAMVELTTPSGTQRRWILGGGSFQSVDAPIAYFGLGSVPESELGELSLRVTWPDGKVTETTEVPVNQRIRIGHSGEKPSYHKLSGRSR